MISKPTGPEDNSDPDRAEEEAGVGGSARAMMERLGHEPATLAEFEAVYGSVKLPDGEG